MCLKKMSLCVGSVVIFIVIFCIFIGIMYNSAMGLLFGSVRYDLVESSVSKNPNLYMRPIEECGDKDIAGLMTTDRDNILNSIYLDKVIDDNTVEYSVKGLHSKGIVDKIVEVPVDNLAKVVKQKQYVDFKKGKVCLYKYMVFNIPYNDVRFDSQEFSNKIFKSSIDLDRFLDNAEFNLNDTKDIVDSSLCYIQNPREYVYNVDTKVLYHIVLK